MDILEELTGEQREAVLDFSHNLLILACAGSGKTKTITTKIAYALKEGIMRPWQIIAVTFTNKAAAQMRERVVSLIGEQDLRGLEIRTFHSLGSYILRRFSKEAGLGENFCIYDENDSVSLLSSRIGKEKSVVRQIARYISLAKDRGYTAESEEVKNWAEDICCFPECFRVYEKALRETGNVDFADLILLSKNLLETNSEVREFFHGKIKMILVDEYQDSNNMQYLLLKALAGEDTQVVAVGDDDQAIYSFRGAEVKHILSFSTEYFSNVRTINLEKNFRSTEEILSFSNEIIRRNEKRYVKNLVAAHNDHGPKPRIIETENGREEAEAVMEIIKSLSSYGETAVLYRTNAQSRILEQVFSEGGIPCKVVGGLKFYEREEVKDAIAFLYLLLNHKDEVSFRRIINKPKRKIGEQKIGQILSMGEDIKGALESFSRNNESARTFFKAWDNAEKALESGEKLSLIMQRALEETELYSYYRKTEDTALRETRFENLGEVVTALEERGRGRESLSSYLETIALLSPLDEGENIKAVSLMTMHNTKGLEFENVIVTGVEEEYIPGKSKEEEIEEERRILYVACTRAKRKLFLTYALNRLKWGTVYERRNISRFLVGIENKYFDKEKRKSERMVKDNSYTTRGGKVSPFGRMKEEAFALKAKKIPLSAIKRPIKQEEKNKRGTFSVGMKVKSKEYGEGLVTDVKDVDKERVVYVSFKNREGKFIERFASLETLQGK